MSFTGQFSVQDFTNLQKLVVSAAEDGKITEIKNILLNVEEKHKKKIVSGRLNNITPLIACVRNGHHVVAKYLIEECGVDVEETGSVFFDGETIEGTPPLWCAAAAGHLDIIKLLIKHNAVINNTTKTNSTPLRAACFDGRLEIVRYLIEQGADIEIANRHGHTCLMIACYKGHSSISAYLISQGADVNRKSVKGNTALHDCAECGSLKILKQLLDSSAKQDVDAYGLTPLLTACVAGHTNIVEYLLNDPINADRKYDSLKLLGATYVDKKRDISGAISLWRRAISEYAKEHPKLPTYVAPNCPAATEYGNVSNLETTEQLEDLITDPDRIKMQALYIREQILGPAHPDSSYYTRYRGAIYADSGNFKKCISLWLYALRMQQKYLEPLNLMTQSSLVSFTELFYFTIVKNPARHRVDDVNQRVSFEHVFTVFEHSVLEIKRGCEVHKHIPVGERDSLNLHRVITVTLHLVHMLGNLKTDVPDKDNEKFMKLMYEIVKLDPRGVNGVSLLHLACHRQTSEVGRHTVCPFPSVNVVKVLLSVGASVTASDYDNNTALHVAVFSKPVCRQVLFELLEGGAHIDAMNLRKQSPLEILRNDRSISVNILKYLKLTCLAAQVVSTNTIDYHNVVPTRLVEFMKYH